MAITHKDLDWKLVGKAPASSSSTPTQKQKEQPKQNTSQESAKPKDKPPTEYRFKSIRIIEPAQGFVENKRFDIKGEVEQLGSDITRPRVIVYPYGLYKGKQDKYEPSGIEAFIDKKTLEFSCTCKSLYYPMSYNDDKEKPADATFELGATAEGSTAEKSAEADKIKLPGQSEFIVLKKDDYDVNGARKYDKPQSGETFKPKNIVKELQADLIKTDFLPKNSEDGYFGEKTDKAVREFQKYAMETARMKRKVGKVEQTGKKLQQSQPDGIVGKKTRDELDEWIKNEWVKPIAPLRHGEVDDNGVENGKGKQDSEEHHKGSPVSDIQQTLKKIGAYSGAIDGWFWGMMKDAVKMLQECGEKGEFYDAKGNKVILEEKDKLKGHSPSVKVMDAKKIELAKKAEEMGLVVKVSDLITLDMLKSVCTNINDAYFEQILPYLNEYASLYKVDSLIKVAHCLSQMAHESDLRVIDESLYYKKAEGMQNTYNSKLKDGTHKYKKLWDDPEKYVKNSKALASYVYANRMGNGDEASGDGYKYRGRGLIQITGKNNYEVITKVHNETLPKDVKDFVADPDLLTNEIKYGIEASFIWWKENNVSSLCINTSEDTVKSVTKRINGGLIGYDDRLNRFNKIINLIGKTNV